MTKQGYRARQVANEVCSLGYFTTYHKVLAWLQESGASLFLSTSLLAHEYLASQDIQIGA